MLIEKWPGANASIPARTIVPQIGVKVTRDSGSNKTFLRVSLLTIMFLALLAALGTGQVSAQSVCASQSTEPTSPLIRDCETLLGLKDQLDPDDVLNWSGTLPLNQWHGVTSVATVGVTSLHLSRYGLGGSIPAAIGNLGELKNLDLEYNDLTGNIPSQLGNLSRLARLFLRNNQLTGNIPSQIGSLSVLKKLNLGDNMLQGTIPSTLSNLSELELLVLRANQLTGAIPTFVGNLTKLKSLHLPHNQLTGTIPSNLDNLTELEILHLGNNQLTGTIPSNLGNLSKLKELYLYSNLLTGSIPPSLAGIATLMYLGIQCNMIDYTIPPGLQRPGLRIGVGAICGAPQVLTYDPPPPPRVSTRSSGGSSGGGGGGSTAPHSSLVGSTSAATANELPGDKLRLDIHGQPSNSIQLGIGWVSRDASQVNLVGVIRDQTLGQTYLIVRHEGYPHIVRRWVPPYSPLIYAINWPLVITQFSFPVEVISAIPLDHRHPPPNMLVRRFDGFDVRIFVYDAALQQWRHIPDYGTFQTMGFYWCNVTAADPHFFDRITIGPAIPSSNTPIRSDHPNCSTG